MAQDSGEPWVLLLDVSGGGLSQTLRYARSNTDISSGGSTYRAGWFDVSFQNHVQGKFSGLRIIVDNIDQELLGEIRAISQPPAIEIKQVLKANPNTVLISSGDHLRIKTYSHADGTIVGTIAPIENLYDSTFPERRVYPSNFPGGF
ncbi:MAG: hypothetical protein NPIRA02_29500 [Nitrospirales bacterium]|nr:MAG: hypothetical protein NPIRA02_29500 [Nitrospirales bacterium]